nr:uncharacterized protein LOC125418334 [Ziziphus jujuba var. spinosa]
MKIQLFFSFLFIFHLFILSFYVSFAILWGFRLSLQLYGFASASPFSLFPPQVKIAALCVSKASQSSGHLCRSGCCRSGRRSGCEICKDGEFFAPTTYRNALRVLHAMQLPEPA